MRSTGQQPGKDEGMSEEQAVVMTETQFARLTNTLAVYGLLPEAERSTKDVGGVLGIVELACQRVKELEPRAADGDQYRNDLISEALAEGVRAYGDKFAKDTYEATLRGAPLAVIKQMKADWATVGDSRFAGGDRQTTVSLRPTKTASRWSCAHQQASSNKSFREGKRQSSGKTRQLFNQLGGRRNGKSTQ
jgi:hypothetical protein